MARKKKGRRRKRVDRKKVRENAKQGGGRGASWLKLPDGVEQWAPEKKGKYKIDVVPYEVTDTKHPDEVEAGSLWYKRSFTIHHGIGPSNSSVVCPLSVGKRCPIHEERDQLYRDGKEDLAKDLRGQTYVAMNILHPDDRDQVAIFCMSQGKFWSCDAGLQNELDQGDDDILGFYDTEGGKTIIARFSEDSFEGRKYLKCSRIDFKDRKDMDEDEIVEKTINLDEIIQVMSYKKLKALFLSGDEEEEDEEEEDEDEEDEEDEEEDEEDEDEEDEEEDEEDEEDEDEEDEDEDEEEEEEEKPKRRSKKKTKAKGKTKGKKKPKCPGGGTFGKDFEELDECEDCPYWDACEAAN